MGYCIAASQGDKGRQTGAFMRLAQSKLQRAIPHAEDISGHEGGGWGRVWGGWTMKRHASGRFTVGSRITEHGQTILNVFKGNEEEERAKGGIPHASITLSGWQGWR